MSINEVGMSRRQFLGAAAATAAVAGVASVTGSKAFADEAAEEEAEASTGTYTAGTYTATATGIGTVTVTVTFDETSITEVVLDVSNETETIGQAAADELIEQVLAAQSADIEGVSGATLTSTAVATGVADCIAQASGTAAEEETEEEATEEEAAEETAEESTSSWKDAPEEVTDFVAEYDYDAVVVGHGFAGTCAWRYLAEAGYNAVLVEKQDEDSYAAVGNEFASLNSDVLQDAGVPEIDPVEFYQNWIKITGNAVNQELVMKFAQNSGETTNWYLNVLSEDELATMTTAFFPTTEHQMDELSGIKFWPSVCSFYGDCSETTILTHNAEAGIEAGGTVDYGTEAQYVIMEDGAVAGLVASTEEGYVKYNTTAVVIACGGFGGNSEMMNDLLYDVAGNLVGDEALSCMDSRDGRGVQMAYWAGAHLETTPVPGMNFRGLSVPGKMNCLPQAVWIDENGKRFCNEYYPVSEQRGLNTVFRSRATKYAVCDANFAEYRQYTLPQHAGFEATDENIESLQASLDEAYNTFLGVTEDEEEGEGQGGGSMSSVTFIADDTLEGLAAQLGLEGDAATNFVETIETYNSYCEAGVDEEFGRAAEVLFPCDTPPYYAASYDPVLGETMTTLGGIITDGDQNALDENFEPIPGLYVSGNDCGRRFGTEYITPIPGVSIGMALTLGREAGKSVAEFLG